MSGVQQQRDFAARIRQPEAQPLLSGITSERMAIYEELFFNNVASLVGGAFPVLRCILGAERWQRLLRAHRLMLDQPKGELYPDHQSSQRIHSLTL